VARQDHDHFHKEVASEDRDGGHSDAQPVPLARIVSLAEMESDLSSLHYRSGVGRFAIGSAERIEGPDGDLEDAMPFEREVPEYMGLAEEGRRQNSLEGRAEAKPYVGIPRETVVAVPIEHLHAESCSTPDFYHGGESVKPYGYTIQNPKTAFGSEADTASFLADLEPKMPFYLPYRHPDVDLWQGWLYGGGNVHTAIDWGRSKNLEEGDDATFGVFAVGDGEVRAVHYHGSGGNIVVIEHTAPDGTTYLSRYMHLRNGRDNDILIARSLSCAGTSSADARNRCEKYQKFANDFADHVSWGKNEHTLRVQVGDQVKAGHFIGWAGNTGIGAAPRGMNADGEPTNFRANNHLHFSFEIEHPTQPDTFVTIDPFGVFGKVDSDGCYDLLAETPFARFFAPFFPTFHAVPFDVYDRKVSYWVRMGYSPQTRCLHRRGDELLVSGSFQAGIAGAWRALSYLTAAEFEETSQEFFDDGFIMRETNVVRGLDGSTRFNAIWRRIESGESIVHHGALTPSRWSENWQNLVLDGPYTVEDYFGYVLPNGNERRSALYTTRLSGTFHSHRNLTSSDMQDTFDDRREEGLFPVSFSATEFPDGVRYTGMFRPVSGCWKLHWGLTPLEYQFVAAANLSQGYRLHRIQGYLDSTRYLAIFKRASDSGFCP